MSAKSGKSQGIHFIPSKVREKSGNFVKSQGISVNSENLFFLENDGESGKTRKKSGKSQTP